MDKIVIYDTETTNSTIWGSIIEVGAVVVDKNLKVWNTSNIFVNGSVTFPCSSHANITLTSLALSERLASYLKKKY